MDKKSVREINTRRSPTLRRAQKSNSSATQQCAASAKDDQTRRTKRKASHDKKTPKKRTRVSDSEPHNISGEDLRVRLLKRKVREDGEGPSKRNKKRRSDINDSESTSSSVDTGRESSSNPLEDCNTCVEHVKRRSKRKAAADGEGPSRKRKRSPDLKETKQETNQKTNQGVVVDSQRAEFETKYQQKNQLGKGGCGSVFAGYRKADNLPVAIKHIPKDKVFCKQADKNGKQLSVEVAIMLKLAAETTGSVGMSAPVSLLDWYDLDQELILVLERPVPSVDLFKYIQVNGGYLQEQEAKIILKQLVDAAKELEDKHIFHRDIKVENILIETDSDVPRVRLIDFGLGCFVKKGSFYRVFYGTSAHVPPEWYNHCIYRAGPTTVWQLGVVLFESLHGNTLFETTKFLKNKLKINKKLSKNCQDFLRTCLTKAPKKRPTLEQLQLHPWLR